MTGGARELRTARRLRGPVVRIDAISLTPQPEKHEEKRKNREEKKRTFIWLITSNNCPGAIVPIVSVILSVALFPASRGVPAGNGLGGPAGA